MAFNPTLPHVVAPRRSDVSTPTLTATTLLPLRSSEWLLFVFFLYVAALGLWRNRGLLDSTTVLIIPFVLVALARADVLSRHSYWSMTRDWISAPLMLVAYWSVDWNATPISSHRLEYALIGFDRTLLNEYGLRSAAERFGTLVPTMLEASYLLLYAVLPLIIAWFYVRQRRHQLERFLVPFLLGSLMAYALLPHFPTQAPCLIFIGEDLPRIDTALRRLNLWILEHGDIQSSVFPSGHVAVAFSTAFAMWLAIPERRSLGGAFFALALLVWINTIYGRYHYAADGLAALLVSALSIGGLALGRRYVTRLPA
jgi:membrane-associated phospholipid phosphatase